MTAHDHMMAMAGSRTITFSSPMWSRGPILPPSMVDILEESDVDEESEEQEDGLEDYDEPMAIFSMRIMSDNM